jgi:myo-inositol-1(or 4)-monophosphatase
MHPLINIATKAIRSASKIILHATDRLDAIHITEKSHNDFVTDIDQQVEQEIIKIIHESYPDHAIVGEESGVSGASDYTWIIDPIDGTTNFLHGHPHFCVAVGVKYKDRMEHGIIYDPLRQELFSATAGSGAFLNNRRIRVAQRKQLAGTLISLCLGNKIDKDLEGYLKILASILPQAAGIRRSGSSVLDLAYVACGRIDGVCSMSLAPWDIAAGSLIIQEAGGIVTDFSGGNNYLFTGNMVAGNQNISKIILQIVQEKVSVQ